MGDGSKYDRISARVHPSEKAKLKKNGYNARQAIEYFNSIAGNKLHALKIDEYFLNREIEELHEQLAIKEMRLAKIQQSIDNLHRDKLSSLRVDSYQKLIDLYNRNRSNQSFENFISGEFIMNEYVADEVNKFPECDTATYCNELFEYYNDVVLVGRTF